MGATGEDFAGAVGLVTGAAGGIGHAVTEALSAAGARVAALDLTEARAGALALTCDVTDEDQLRDAVEQAERELGPVRFLVCAAGVVSERPVVDLELNEWRRVVDTSLLGTFLTVRAVLPRMLEHKRGRIVALSSGYATKGYRDGAHYAAAKAGIEAFVKSVALEVAHAGITVNAVAPGPVTTGMLEPVTARPGWRAAITSAIPLGRIAAPDDVVGPIVFLLGEQAAYVTGQVVHVNGGLLMP